LFRLFRIPGLAAKQADQSSSDGQPSPSRTRLTASSSPNEASLAVADSADSFELAERGEHGRRGPGDSSEFIGQESIAVVVW
jgi:Flp pilus assembly protein CpaB